MEIFMGVSAALSIATFLHSMQVNKSRASKKELDDLRAEDEQLRTALIAHTERLATLETRIAHMPNSASIERITKGMGEMSGNFRELLGEFRSIQKQVANIDDFLRHHK